MTNTPLSPPPHICGPLYHGSPHHRERTLWIAAQDASCTNRQIGKALGISAPAVLAACPDRATRTGIVNAPRPRKRITLPDAPMALPAAHDETAPRRGIMSTPRGSARIAAVIAAIRAEHHRHTQQEDHA